MQEVINIEYLAQYLPSIKERRYFPNIEAEAELKKIKIALQRVDLHQSILIIKGFSIFSEEDINWFIKEVICKLIYIPTRKIIPCIDKFSVEPFLNLDFLTLSESSRVGGFHSDFWSATMPPKYTFLQCIKPDPRHPYFGRNQYVKIGDIFESAKLIFGESTSLKIMNHDFKYKNSNDYEFSFFKNGITRFHEHLVLDEPMKDGVTFISAIREIALSKCNDFSLDTGEIAIINNHKGLHRRGEATVSFIEPTVVNSRCLQTVRFS